MVFKNEGIAEDTNSEGAALIANKLLTEVQALQIHNPTSKALAIITISIGFAIYSSNNIVNPEGLIKAADIQLYSAKQNGRNKIYPTSLK